jgi:hypothetical protein
MKKLTRLLPTLLAALASMSYAATVTVTNLDDGVSNVGAPGTFYWAITNCNAGDTIAFNIPGTGPFFLKAPSVGFPLIYRKHNLLIDGYTQSGASPNSNPITGSNNAVIKIVIDGRNGNTRNMWYEKYAPTNIISDPPIDNSFMKDEAGGYSATERALLGVYRSTNVNIRGLAFLAKEPPNAGGEVKAAAIGAATSTGAGSALTPPIRPSRGSPGISWRLPATVTETWAEEGLARNFRTWG